MKKILIIGAGVEQVPAIRIAKEMGHYVISTDMNLKAPGIKYADLAYKVSTTDVNKNIAIAKKEKIDGVMTVSSETAVTTVAEVASVLNLPCFSVDTALKATDKAEMRKIFVDSNIRIAPFVIARNFSEVQSFINSNKGPWVLKPVDSSGQRGTSLVSNENKLEDAFINALSFSKSKNVLVDKFMSGPEVHVTMQVINSSVHFLALSDRITLDANNFGIAVRHVGPSLFDNKIVSSIKKICKKCIKAIGLRNGVATCELIIFDNEPVVMEVAIRTPGGYLRDVAMHLSGIDIIKSTIWYSLGYNKSYSDLITENSYCAVSVKFLTNLNIHPSIRRIVTVTNIDKVKNIDGIKLSNIHFDGEFDVPALNSSVGRFGAIIGVGSSRKVALEKTEIAFNTIKINGIDLIDYKSYNKHNILYN